MPIKQLKKTLWIFSGIMGFFLIVTALIIFSSKEAKGKELPKIPEPVDRTPKPRPNIYHYSIVWEAKANTNPPPRPKPVAPVRVVKQNYLEQMIRRSLKIINIMSDSYAIVRFRGRDNLLEIYDPKSSNKQSKGIINLGSKAYVVKIVPEKGIKFRNDNGEQAWLHLPHLVESYRGLVKKMSIKLRGARKGNNWQVVPEESSRLAKNYNKYLNQMRLKPHFMGGKPIGLRIRKVSSENEAHYYGLRQDDIVTNINNTSLKNITSAKDIKKLIKRYRTSKNVRIKLLRGGRPVVLNYNFGN